MNTSSKQIIQSAYQVLSDVTAGRLSPTVYRNLEALPKAQAKTLLQWWQAGNTGNDGGASPVTPHGNYTWFPSVPEVVTILPVAAFDNFFFITTFPIPQVIPDNFVLAFDNYSVTHDSLAGTQAIECQVELRDGINVYNMAWQFDLASKAARIFNFTKGIWVTVANVPFPDISKPLTFKAEFRIDRVANTTTHDCVWINGTRYDVSITQAATPQAGSVEISAAFQIDPNSIAPVTAEISNMSVAWL